METTKQQKEERLKTWMERYFKGFGFDVYREVVAVDSRLRIDIVINHTRCTWFWAGIEVKNFGKKTGKDLAEHVQQAVKYRKSRFLIAGAIRQPMPIFIYPPISVNFLHFRNSSRQFYEHAPNHRHNNVNSFLAGVAGIGEFRKIRQDNHALRILVYNNQPLWEQGNEPSKYYWDLAIKHLNKQEYLS